LCHRVAGEAHVLIYETDDSDFANSAVEALKQAGIDAYATGGSLPGGSSPTISIYIRDASDSAKANEILIKLGAVSERPVKLPPAWLIAILAVVVVLLALWSSSKWK
jgi:hypothetical protein